MAQRLLPSPGREDGGEGREGGREGGGEERHASDACVREDQGLFSCPLFISGPGRAFQEAGLAAGVIGVVLVALFSYFTLWFLIRCVSGMEGGKEEGRNLTYLSTHTHTPSCKRHLSASGSGDAGAARGLKQQEESGDDGGADKGKHLAMAVLAPTPLPPSQQQQQQWWRWRGLQDNDGLQQLTYAEVRNEFLAVGVEGKGRGKNKRNNLKWN